MTNNAIKSARQMIDDLINDDHESAKQNFHDFLKSKTIHHLNPNMIDSDSDSDSDSEDVNSSDDYSEDDYSGDDSSEDDSSEDEEFDQNFNEE